MLATSKLIGSSASTRTEAIGEEARAEGAAASRAASTPRVPLRTALGLRYLRVAARLGDQPPTYLGEAAPSVRRGA